MPGTPQNRRYDPRGLLLGTWKHAGQDAVRANAVYGSRDKQTKSNQQTDLQGVCNRTAGKWGHFHNKKTACSHEDIDYLPQYQGHRFLLTGVAGSECASALPVARIYERKDGCEGAFEKRTVGTVMVNCWNDERRDGTGRASLRGKGGLTSRLGYRFGILIVLSHL